MITKFTSKISDFEIDLSNQKITFVEANNWLSNKDRTKYIYPVEFELTNEQFKDLKGITDFNSRNRTTVIDGLFSAFGRVHEAVLTIKSFIGRNIKAEISYGLEEFPNFNKQLSQLPLEKLELSNSIYDHALTIINQTWPNVNYNFPQIITEQFDTNNEQWAAFEGFINNYANNVFLENEYDSVNNIQINRNVIQPLPYVLHIFKTGFEDAGYTLTGEILTDPDFIRMCEASISDYYTKFTTQTQQVALNTSEYYQLSTGNKALYAKQVTFPEPGRYKIAGNFYVRAQAVAPFTWEPDGSFISFIFNGVPYWEAEEYSYYGAFEERFLTLDINIDYHGTEGDLYILSEQLYYGFADGELQEFATIVDLTVTQLAKFDSSGNTLPTLVVPTDINLSKCVPEMTFGEYVTAYLNWKGYALDIDGENIVINKLKKQIENIEQKEDLSNNEVLMPEITPNQDKSYEISFFNFESDEYDYKSVLVNNQGYTISPYIKEDETTEVIIDAIHLPIKTQNGITTAHYFIDDNTKSKVVAYTGLQNGLNTTEALDNMLINNIYLSDLQFFYQFLLNNLTFTWSFINTFEKFSELQIKSKIYAYKQYHIIKTLRRKMESPDVIEYEIESQTLE